VPASGAQVIVSVPGELQVGGGPYNVPISINGAQRVSTLTLTLTYDPAVLRVRSVQDGTFMRGGGVTAAFTPKIDAASGRIDIAFSRAKDAVGASGNGLVAVVLLDAVAAGSTTIAASGVATTPEGAPVPLQFSPARVTVR
jgi:hypothetical protein